MKENYMSDDKKNYDDEIIEDETVVSDPKNENEKKTDDDEYEKVCFMCRRPESKAGKMIDLPNHIHICPECM